MTFLLSFSLLCRVSQFLYGISQTKTYTVKTVPITLFWLRFPSVDLVDEERLETYENNLLKHYEGNKIKDIPEYPGLCL